MIVTLHTFDHGRIKNEVCILQIIIIITLMLFITIYISFYTKLKKMYSSIWYQSDECTHNGIVCPN